MKSYTRIPIKKSIVTRLLKVVFSLYLIIATGVTLGHMFMEYRYQKDSISRDLKDIQKTFEQGLALDLWQMDQNSLHSTIKGMLEIPVIVGVEIQNTNNLNVAVGGIIAQGKAAANCGLHVDLLGLDPEASSMHKNEPYTLDVFMHQFPIVYTYENEIRPMGTATLYSSTSVIFRRVKMGFLLLGINAVLKTVALWFIFLYFSNKLLRIPLADLTSATRKVNLENLDSFKIDIGISDHNELKLLETSFNSMIGNLSESVCQKEQAKAELIASHDRFLTVLDGIEATIYVADMETYEILFMNKYMIDTFKQDLTGEICWKALRGESGQCSCCTNDRLTGKNGNTAGVCVWQDKNPITDRLYINHDRAIEWTDGRLVRLQIATDVTDIRKMEERLRQAQKMEAIGNLAGGIAHDFNNLLYPIIGLSEMLLEDLPQNSLEHENSQVIFNAGQRAGGLVKQILAFSRQSDHRLTPVRVQNVLKEVLKLCRSTIPANIEIRENIQQNCGLVMADPTQVHQVAMNLITNAFHAMEDKNGMIDIGFKETTVINNELPDSSLLPGKYVLLSVSDNGIGMDSSTVNNIFEPYFTTKEKGKGTGLGLAVVYGIVKEHKGEVKVYSEKGKGTTFNIYLPLIAKSTERADTDHEAGIVTGTENILLVDDEESVATLEGLILSRLGYRVTVKTSSVDALNAFRANPDLFDMVISDMTMPGMTGDQLSKNILLIRPDTPIIICTGFSERINKEQAGIIGVKGFLMKPVVKSDMAHTVRKVLDESSG